MVTSRRAQSHPDGASLQWCTLNTAYDKNKRRLSKEFSLCFQDGYDQFALKMTTCVARSNEPFLTKVQFVAIIIISSTTACAQQQVASGSRKRFADISYDPSL